MKTRVEMYLEKIAGSDIDIPAPVTREEMFLAAIAGMDITPPVPITRKEMFLSDLLGISSYNLIPETREEYFIAKAIEKEEPIIQPITIEEFLWSGIASTGGFYTLRGFPPLTLQNAIEGKIRSLIRYGAVDDTDGIVINNGTVTADGDSIIVTGTPEEVRLTGTNQWDEEWVLGYFGGDGNWNNGNYVSSKNPIIVEPNTTYRCVVGTSEPCYITYWTESVSSGVGHQQQFIERSTSSVANNTFTTPSNCHAIHFNCGAAYGSEYKKNITINYPSTETDYAPYTSQTASVADLFAVGDIRDEHDIISGKVTRRTEAKVEDGEIVIDIRGQQYSGSTVTFEAESARPIDKVEASFSPVQDLHGYDSPWSAGGGKNKADYPGMITAGAVEQSDGSLYVASAVAFNSAVIFQNDGTTGSFTVTFIVKNDSTSRGLYPVIYYMDATTESMSVNKGYDTYTTFTKVSQSAKTIDKIVFSYGTGSVKTWFYVQVESGSTATPWTPYSNECPISGWTALDIYNEPDYDPTAQPKTTLTFPTTVYGGTATVAEDGSESGSNAYGIADLGDLTWTRQNTAVGGKYRFYAVLPQDAVISDTDNINSLCEVIPLLPRGATYNANADGYTIVYASNVSKWQIYVYMQEFSEATVQEFTAGIAGFLLAYKLATPTPFTPVASATPTAVQGINTMWTDGDNLTVTMVEPLIEQVAPQPLNTSEGTNTIEAYSEAKVEYRVSEEPENG